MKPVTSTHVPARRDSQVTAGGGRQLLLALFTQPMADRLRTLLHPTAPVECFQGDAHELLEWVAQPPARWLFLPPTHGEDVGIGPVVLRLSTIGPSSLTPWITIVLSDSTERGRDVLEAVRAGASVARLSELSDLVKGDTPPFMPSTPPHVYAQGGALADTMENLEQILAFLVTDPVGLSILLDALGAKKSAQPVLAQMSPHGVRHHLRTRGLPPPSTLSVWARLLRSASMCTHGIVEEASARACGFSSRRAMRRAARRLLRCDDRALPPWQIDLWIAAFQRQVVFGIHRGAQHLR